MKHDIFVSYAHNDDQPPKGATEGWITTFVDELKRILTQRVGRKPDVWMDYLLLENEKVDATLKERVTKSQTIVLFMSPSYLNSDWCELEIGKFLAENSSHKNKESVFIVAIEETDREKWHSRLQTLTPLQLYEKSRSGASRRLGDPRPPDNGEHEYWRQLNELAHLIKLQLELINQSKDVTDHHIQQQQVSTVTSNEGSASGQPAKIPTVWIAQPTEDLQPQWEGLAASIRQRGAHILPIGHSTYPLGDIHAFRQAIESDLSESDLLIQLLSAQADNTAKFLQLQALAAKIHATASNAPFLQWRAADIDLQAITDSAHRELLQGIIACGFTEFSQQVLEQLDKLMNPAPGKITHTGNQNALTLCITAGQKDAQLAEDIAGIVNNLNHTPIPIPPVPDPGQKIEDYNADLRALLNDVDGVILAHSQENEMWLHGQHARVRKGLTHRQNTWGAFVDALPLGKRPILCSGPGLMYLDCRDGLKSAPIQRFIDTLLSGG